jgi:hypothetical protein
MSTNYSSLCSFLHSPVTSPLLDPNILLRTPFSNTLGLCSSHFPLVTSWCHDLQCAHLTLLKSAHTNFIIYSVPHVIMGILVFTYQSIESVNENTTQTKRDSELKQISRWKVKEEMPGDIWVWKPRWNDTDRRKTKNSENSLSHFHFVLHKSHSDWPVREPGSPRWEAGD